MARRTRSLSELPGHLRVPILRRKDTERTKERLAAGLAGMEELKSLREQQQLLIGQTVAKADKRQDQRHYGDTSSSSKHRKENASNSSTSSPAAQTTIPPRQSQHSRSASFRGYSMDSISEEEDANCKNSPNNNMATGPMDRGDINNNIECGIGSKSDQTFLAKYDTSSCYYPNPSYLTPSPDSQPYTRQIPEDETRSRYGTASVDGVKGETNPLRHRVLQDSVQNRSQHKMTSSRGTLSRQHSVSDRQCQQPPVSVSQRQRSMSVDMGHGDIRSFHPLDHSVPGKQRKLPMFSSLSCLSTTRDNDESAPCPGEDFDVHPQRSVKHTSRLSQSTSQINDVNGSLSSYALKRRGSLKWDSLLQSIGIQNSVSSTALDKGEEIDKENNETTPDNGIPFEPQNTDTVGKYDSPTTKKKGRSMSFSYGQSMIGANSPSQEFSTNERLLNGFNNDTQMDSSCHNQFQQSNTSNLSQAVQPILRRASIQCEAVLTNHSRIVNPIQDVDVNSLKRPGPVHAVMLQYSSYNSPRARGISREQNDITSTPNKKILAPRNNQVLSQDCLQNGINTVKHPSEIPQTLPSHPLDGSRGGPRFKPTQAQECDIVMQENVRPEHNNNSCKVNGQVAPNSDTSFGANSFREYNKNSRCSSPSSDSEQTQCTLDTLTTRNDEVSSKNFKSSTHQPARVSPPLSQHYSHRNIASPSDASQTPLSQQFVNCDSAYKHVVNSRSHASPSEMTVKDNNKSLHEEQKGKTLADNSIVSDKPETPENVSSANYEPHNNSGNENQNVRVEERQTSPGSFPSTPRYYTRDRRSISQSRTSLSLYNNSYSNGDDSAAAIRAKRSSIFSDISLMSDSSGRTPSSAASVFSDVSMVSDEGYSTSWEPISPDGKSVYMTRFSTSTSSTPMTFSSAETRTHHATQLDNGHHVSPIKGTGQVDTNGNKFYDNGGQRVRNRSSYETDVDKETNESPAGLSEYKDNCYHYETNNSSRAPVYRKPLKQTSV